MKEWGMTEMVTFLKTIGDPSLITKSSMPNKVGNKQWGMLVVDERRMRNDWNGNLFKVFHFNIIIQISIHIIND